MVRSFLWRVFWGFFFPALYQIEVKHQKDWTSQLLHVHAFVYLSCCRIIWRTSHSHKISLSVEQLDNQSCRWLGGPICSRYLWSGPLVYGNHRWLLNPRRMLTQQLWGKTFLFVGLDKVSLSHSSITLLNYAKCAYCVLLCPKLNPSKKKTSKAGKNLKSISHWKKTFDSDGSTALSTEIVIFFYCSIYF